MFLFLEIDIEKVVRQSQHASSVSNSFQNQSPELLAKPVVNNSLGNFTPSHSRNSSSSTTNSTVNSNNCLSINPNPFVNGHYRFDKII